MMLSEKLKDAIVIVPFGLAELDGPPVEPHEVVTRARATMLAPRTKIRFKNICSTSKKMTEKTTPPSPGRVLILWAPPSGLILLDVGQPACSGAGRRRARIRRSVRARRP